MKTPFGEYEPKPVDTSDVTLPPEMEPLQELIAENVHDTWAAGRMKEGWTYGSERDDAKKHNPTLVPYDHLSESEQQYDRDTASATLKLLVKLGWKVSPPEE